MSEWDGLRQLIEGGGCARWDRLEVLSETSSTQDTARELCAGRAGLVVIAERQTAGRGRLGRAWEQAGGLAMTFVVEASAPGNSDGVLPLAAGVAAAEACEDCLPRWGRIALRWPNDVVLRSGGRKLAGVLIEGVGRLALVGIGINVAQAGGEWPEKLRDRATSLAALGSSASRGDVAAVLARRLDAGLDAATAEIVTRWKQRDALFGTRRTFLCDGRTITGLVVGLEPTSEISVRDDTGTVHPLPAATTSLVP